MNDVAFHGFITAKQFAVLDYMRQAIASKGEIPEMQAIADEIGVNVDTVRSRIDKLIINGWMSKASDGELQIVRWHTLGEIEKSMDREVTL